MRKTTKISKKLFKQLSTWLLLVLAFLILSQQINALTTDKQMAADDFVEYWSAARLEITGGNPYSPDQLLPLQIEAGRYQDVPVMMWNPPWVLTLALPFGLVGYPLSRFLWFLSHVSIIFFSVNAIWQIYGADRFPRWLAWLVCFTFGPVIYVLSVGQIGPILLLGEIGFLFTILHKRYFAAGAFLVLLTIKPHLVYLVLIAVFLWSIKERCWSILAGFFLTLMACLIVVLLFNPAVLTQYFFAVNNYPPSDWATPTLGGALRMLFGYERFWLQLVPSILGSIIFIIFWYRTAITWDWKAHMPVLIMLSVATAAYGWIYDQIILLLPMLPLVALLLKPSWTWKNFVLILVYFAANITPLFSSGVSQLYFWWLPVWQLGWYFAAHHYLSDIGAVQGSRRKITASVP